MAPADDLPDTMRAFQLTRWQQAPELCEIPVPRPGPGEVLLRVAGNGLCHSDLTMMEMPGEIGDALGWHVPFTLGHEIAGTIAAVGPHEAAGIDVGRITVGDAYALMSANSCGTCRFCRAGRDSLCADNMVGRGYGRDGGLAEFVIAPARDLVPLGDLDPMSAGTLTDAGATSYHAVVRVLDRLPRFGDDLPTVLVIGVGGLGTFTVQILAALADDIRIVAVDPDPARRELAVGLGAAVALETVGREGRRELTAAVGPDGAAGVIDIVGTDETIAGGIGALARAGVFALVGAGGGHLAKPWFSTLPHEAEVFTFQGSGRSDVEGVIALARDVRIRVDVEPYPLSRVDDAYDALRDGTLRRRALVSPD